MEDLTPLKGIPLTTLSLFKCSKVRDLTPLKGMPLTRLLLGTRQVDLSPLDGMHLEIIDLGRAATMKSA